MQIGMYGNIQSTYIINYMHDIEELLLVDDVREQKMVYYASLITSFGYH